MSFYHVKSILYQTFQKEDRIFSYSHLTQNVAKTPSVRLEDETKIGGLFEIFLPLKCV